MAPHSISLFASAGVRAAAGSRLLSALLFGPAKNGNGVGVLSMIGPNPPMIIWVGIDEEDMFDNKKLVTGKQKRGRDLSVVNF